MAQPLKPPALLSGELCLAGRLDARSFALLQALADTGSLQRAARAAGYTYKGAWLLLETLSNLTRSPLLLRRQGGRGGGGTQLSPEAQQLLASWQLLQERHRDFLRTQEAWLMDQPGLAHFLKRTSMKASARNQFSGSIVSLAQGPASTEVGIDIGAGRQLQASLCSSACAELALQVGQEVVALLKASEVVLVTDFGSYQMAGGNQLSGHISQIRKGGASAGVTLTLPGGSQLSASVTLDAIDALGLSVGQTATAVFPAAALLLAVAR
jgi:molybdate transport system regulatory protein